MSPKRRQRTSLSFTSRCFRNLAESDENVSNKFLREVDKFCAGLKEGFLGKEDGETDDKEKKKEAPVKDKEKPVEKEDEKQKDENTDDDIAKILIDDSEVDTEKHGVLGLSKYFATVN